MGRLFVSAADMVINAGSMSELCTALEKCRRMFDSGFINKEGFSERLKSKLAGRAEALEAEAARGPLSHRFCGAVRLYRDVAACLVYIAFKAGYCTTPFELAVQLDDLVSLLSTKTTGPKNVILDELEISLLLDLLESKFNFCSALTCGKKLEIYLVNRSHLLYDSWLETYKNTYTGRWVNKWMVMTFSPCIDTLLCGRHFVFLHEMGHILYNEITNGGAGAPWLFPELSAVMGMPWRRDEHKLPELFCDLFAAAAMNSSRFAAYSPYARIFPPELAGILEEYFKILVAKAGRGYYDITEKKVLHE